MGIVFNKRTN